MMKIRQYIKFCIVGGIGIIPNYFTYKILSSLGLWDEFSWFIGVLMGATSNYILNVLWVFNEDSPE